jgi:hypothetical protein
MAIEADGPGPKRNLFPPAGVQLKRRLSNAHQSSTSVSVARRERPVASSNRARRWRTVFGWTSRSASPPLRQHLGSVSVYDGGADGVTTTLGDNTLFETDALFFP